MSAVAVRPSFATASRELLRDTVLDAVTEALGERRWRDVSMAEVATRAGVSRQTLYNVFGSRQELAQAYVIREAERFLDAVAVAVRAHAPDARAALSAALELFLSAAGSHPLVRAISSPDGGEELLPLVTTRGRPVVDDVTERLAALFVESWPGLARRDARPLADALVRLAISHAGLSAGSAQQTAAAIARILGPHLDQLVAEID